MATSGSSTGNNKQEAMNSHEQQQQQQQAEPRLLQGLPVPVLSAVLHLGDEPYSPALCRLSCVSKAAQAAAAAAAASAAPVHVRTRYICDRGLSWSPRPKQQVAAAAAAAAAHATSVATWIHRHRHRVRGLTVKYEDDPEEEDPVLAVAAGLAAPPAPAAAGAAGVGASGQLATSTAHAAAAAHTSGGSRSSEPGPPVPLERLHLLRVAVSQGVVNALVNFDRLQVLVIWNGHLHKPVSTSVSQLMHAVSSLRQLQQLSICWRDPVSSTMSGDEVLRALPPRLRAVDLQMVADLFQSTCSSSSLAHLVHLTSLRLVGAQVVPRGQHQQPGAWEEGLGCMSLGREEEQEEEAASQQSEQQQQAAADGLTYLSVSAEVSTQAIWYAPATLEAVEVKYAPHYDVGLTHLAACPRLRQLCVLYSEAMIVAKGVSALTQLTRLRMVLNISAAQASSSSSGSVVGGELAALRQQLKVLELSYTLFGDTQPSAWLPQMQALEELVLVVSPEECGVSPEECGVLSEESVWSSEESVWSPEECGVSPDGQKQRDGSSGGGLQLGPVALYTNLKRLRLVLWSGWDLQGDLLSPQVKEQALVKFQEAAASMTAQLPALEVVCGLDAYTGPCWAGQEELQLDWEYPKQ